MVQSPVGQREVLRLATQAAQSCLLVAPVLSACSMLTVIEQGFLNVHAA